MRKVRDFLSKSNIRMALWLAAICLFVIWAILGYRYQFTYNKGESMEPSYSDGDWIIVEKKEKLPQDWIPDRYDVVIIFDKEHNDKLTKRVIGLAGDIVEIKEGVIHLNENELTEPFSRGKILFYICDGDGNNLKYWSGPDIGKPVVKLVDEKIKKIPEGYVWVIGDNREVTWYGLLKIKDIEGLVIL